MGSGGGQAGGEELARSPVLQVIRNPLLRAAKPEAQRRLLAVLGIKGQRAAGERKAFHLRLVGATQPRHLRLLDSHPRHCAPSSTTGAAALTSAALRIPRRITFHSAHWVRHFQVKGTQSMVFST